MESIFVGRKKELQELDLLAKKRTASLVVVRGRRRIGKSRMLDYFGKTSGYRYIRISGLLPTRKTTKQSQRNEFVLQLSAQLGLPEVQVDDWSKLFALLANYTQTGKVIIVLDEISWMGSKDPDFLGKLKNAWDLHFKNNPELMLILCGSISSWIEKNILSSTAFFGRVSSTLNVEEMTIPVSNELLSSMGSHFTAYEKLKLLSVMGGVPRYLEEIQPKLTVEENITRLCFQKGGILFHEFDHIFADLFGRRSERYKRVVEVLAEGKLEYKDICSKLGVRKSGHILDCLTDLVLAGFISRDYTWHIKSEKESSLSVYRLRDNYLRFYLKYIKPNQGKVEGNHFELTNVNSLQGWASLMGLQFENLVLNNREFVLNQLRVDRNEVVSDNPFYQRKTERNEGCQIDYLIQTKLNVLFACDMKFSRREIDSRIIDEMQQKLSKLVLPKGYSCKPVLIHVNGVSDQVADSGYFFKIIDFSELLQQ